MNFEDAYSKFKELYSHKSDIIQLYANEIACELAFCAMMTDRMAEANTLLDEKLKKFIETYRKVMSSKQRVLCAIALYLDNDRDKAIGIFQSLNAKKRDYLLQGEVKSDLAIMERILSPKLMKSRDTI